MFFLFYFRSERGSGRKSCMFCSIFCRRSAWAFEHVSTFLRRFNIISTPTLIFSILNFQREFILLLYITYVLFIAFSRFRFHSAPLHLGARRDWEPHESVYVRPGCGRTTERKKASEFHFHLKTSARENCSKISEWIIVFRLERESSPLRFALPSLQFRAVCKWKLCVV